MIGQYWANIQYFNPKQIPDLMIWLDATDPNANGIQPSNLSAITTWIDKSGNNNSPTQSVGSFKPLFTINSINNLPTLNFNGLTQYLFNGSISNGNVTTLTFFIVANYQQISAPEICFELSNGTVNTGFIFLKIDIGGPSPQSLINRNDGLSNTSYSTALPLTKYWTLIIDNSINSIYENGILQNSASASPLDPNVTSNLIIAADQTVARYSLINIGEIIVYQSALSVDNQQIVENYLKNRWGF